VILPRNEALANVFRLVRCRRITGEDVPTDRP
jgi:hypothetical protein